MFKIAEVFDITGRGLVVTSHPDTEETGVPFCAPLVIVLKKPDGTALEAEAYFELISPNPKRIIALSLPGLSKVDVPPGTAVWFSRDKNQRQLSDKENARSKTRSASSQVEAASKSKSITPAILLLERDVDVAEDLTNWLQRENYSVDSCQTNLEMLEKALTRNYDLIVLDWDMPAQSAIEICRELRAQKANVPILILGALSSIEKHDAELAGVDDFITKPFVAKELAARMRALMRRDRNI